MTIVLHLHELTGVFAENKDIARAIRQNDMLPAIKNNETVILDFAQVQGATQSFIHALLSELFREYSLEILDQLEFKNCNETIKSVINIVVDYMQESLS